MLRYIRSMPYNMIHLCVDEQDEYKITGTAYNNTIEFPIQFNDIYDVIIKFDDIFNKNGNPLAYNVLRSFQGNTIVGQYQNKPTMICDYEKFSDLKGKITECDIVVKSRRQSNWQGCVFFGDTEFSYSTIMELIRIIEQHIQRVVTG